MSSPTDPVRLLNRASFAVLATVLAGALGCALWAFRPIEEPAALLEPEVERRVRVDPSEQPVLAIDERAFQVRLWNPRIEEQPAPATPAPAPRPRKIEIELISIIDDGAELRAAVYDPTEKRVVMAGEGDVVGGLTIAAITRDGITLSDGRISHALALREPR